MAGFDVNVAIEGISSMDRYVLYTTNNCKYCDRVKKAVNELIASGNIGDVDIRLIPEASERQRLYREWGLGENGSMPQLFMINEFSGGLQRIGGSDDAMDWFDVMYDYHESRD